MRQLEKSFNFGDDDVYDFNFDDNHIYDFNFGDDHDYDVNFGDVMITISTVALTVMKLWR